MRWWLGVGFALVVAGGACGSPFSAGSGGDGGTDGSVADGPGPGEGGAEGGADAAHDGPAGDATGDAPAPATIVYVSGASGNDANDGLSTAHPKKTIVAGLGAAASAGPGVAVEVCAGLYAETKLVVTGAVALLGGYDCTSWTRSPSYGFPTFDPSAVSVIHNGSPATQAATLIVSGAAAKTLVDGFTIDGAPALLGTTSGVHVMDQATPGLTNLQVTGGGGAGGTIAAGSVGILVDSASAPAILECSVSGGTGSGTIGSIGVTLTTTAKPVVAGSWIRGGTGTCSPAPCTGALGMNVLSTMTGTALYGDIVDGTDAAGDAENSVGMAIVGAGLPVDVVSCDIRGGTGQTSITSSVAVAVSAAGATVRLLADRIYGGNRTGTDVGTAGVIANTVGTIQIIDSYVHGGNVPTGAGSTSKGVALGGAGPVVAFDTIYTGAWAGQAIVFSSGATGAIVSDSLLVGANTTDVGILAEACSGMIQSIDHTAFANFDAALYQCTTSATTKTVTTVTGLGALFPSATSDRVVETQSACTTAGDSTYCVPTTACPGAAISCLPALFGASWTTTDDGYTGLFVSKTAVDGGLPLAGWTLATGTSCLLAHGGVPISGITTDAFGATRGPTPTIGAAEYTGICQ
ncbi:MAG TPA: hypothetical protein VIF09_15525 [Polyangiaceae bacterium]